MSSADEHKKTCGECAYWLTPKCPWFEDAKKGLLKLSDDACGEFYPQPKCKKKKEKKPPHKACGLSDQGPFEAIYRKGKPAFLVKTSEGFKILETVTNEGHEVAPKDLREIPYEPYGFYEGEVPNREELFWKVRNEFDRFLDVESIYKDFLAACVLLTYQQEKLRTVPYVYFYGDNESGKTVALTLLSMLCYRPMFGVTIPPADIYGFLDDSDAPGTILEDEVQGLHKDMDKSKIYKAGYKQGAKIPRTFILQHKRFIKYFRCFCFKACAAEEMPRVKGLLERFIFIPMIEGFPNKDWADVDKEDLKRIRQLRDMLLKWRLATVEWELPEVELPVKGRLKELWKPVIRIVQGLTVEKDLRSFLERLQQERLNEKMSTLEGRLVKVVAELYDANPLPFTKIWGRLITELEAKVDEKKPNQMDTAEFGIITKRLVGYRLREVLSGRKRSYRTPEGFTKAYEFDAEKLRRIAKKYGINIVSKCLSFPSVRGITAQKNMRKLHENHVEGMEKTPKKLVETPQPIGHIGHLDTNSLIEEKAPKAIFKNNVSLDTEKPVSGTKPSVAEVLQRLRFTFVEGTEEEFIIHAVEAGLSQDEARSLFEKLKGEELFWLDRGDRTLWRWVNK